jgi:hypothetical protein
MTLPDAKERYRVLSLMTEDKGKFVVMVGAAFETGEIQNAFETMQVEDWIRLIDIGVLSTDHGPRLCRIYLAMPVAREWYASEQARYAREEGKVH